jgi:hypothetical protein
MTSESLNHELTSPGMQHGPFAPPELDSEPTSAQWVMEEAHGDPYLYQLLMLRESLITDRAHSAISREVYDKNMQRLAGHIMMSRGPLEVVNAREHMQKGRRAAWLNMHRDSDPS